MVAKALRHFFNISIGMPFVHKMYGRIGLWATKLLSLIRHLSLRLSSVARVAGGRHIIMSPGAGVRGTLKCTKVNYRVIANGP